MAKKQTMDLPPKQYNLLREILRQHIPNKTVWAFGSRVEWKASETSDLDLAVHKCFGAEIADLKEALEESALLCSVDVLNWENIPDSFRANIKKHYVVVQQNTVHERWRVVKLGDIITLNYGASLPKTKRVWGNIPVYSSAGLIGWHNKPLINQQGIIVGRKGTAGSIHRSKKPFFAIDTSFYISETDTDCDIDFLFYMLSKLGLNYLNFDSAVPGLNRETAYDQNALIPPLAEQKAIAEVLSSLDDNIDILGQIIEKKRMIGQGMMQRLLTRKVRLPGFSGEWEQKRLGDIFTLTRGQVLPIKQIKDFKSDDYQYPVYSSQTSDNGLLGYFNNYMFENAITWTTDGANAGEVKYRNHKFYCTNVCGVLLSNQGYANACVAEAFNMVSKKYVSYVGNPKLMNNTVSKISVRIPPKVSEQIAIATVLSDIDAEIAVLEAKKAKAMQIKQGAMQQLLTGKIRLTADIAQKIADII